MAVLRKGGIVLGDAALAIVTGVTLLLLFFGYALIAAVLSVAPLFLLALLVEGLSRAVG
jgi:mannose/fructose/N-acetylgalactosamine-specific phosphotransferase system component IIC